MKPLLKIIMPVAVILSVAVLPYNYYDFRIDQIRNQLDIFNTKYRQQKVYLHTDKAVYLAGENIWIKAYLMEASSFAADMISKDIYVDLIDFSNTHVQSIILRNKNGYAQGDILLSDTLKEGNYQLRGYTNWMRNFDKDFFFNKTIIVKNPNYENIVTTVRLKEIKKFNHNYEKAERRKSIHFFPEGGYYVAGLQGRVAFKAENDLGQSIHVKGSVFESKGTEITSFESVHDGMGFFEFTPQAHKKYFAEIYFDNGKSEKAELPEVVNAGFSMSADPFSDNEIKVTVQSNTPASQDAILNELIVIAQSHGIMRYNSKEIYKGSPVVFSVPKKLFPEGGIVQVTLFDGRTEPLCERLVFVGPKTGMNASKINVHTQENNDSIIYELKLANYKGDTVNGSLSIAVTEVADDAKPYKENILTNLLLTSDLKGRIDNPVYYFDKSNPDREKHLDLLMLTHGWRRFIWKDIMANKFPSTLYSPSEGIAIAGKITRDHFGIPIPGSRVVLTILNSYNDQFETRTDRRGRFSFPNLNYEDTIDVKIEAYKPAGGRGLQIVIGDTIVPDISTKVYPEAHNQDFDKSKFKANNRRERIEFNKKYKANQKTEEDNSVNKIHNTPNDVMHVGEDATQYSSILQYMEGKVPGVQITGNRVIIRGISTFYGSTDPLFLLDGVPIDASSVPNLSPNDIETIEILKGPEAAIYGSRGANGVIAFYSKRGHFMKRGVIEFGMLGYYKAREFYVPAYDSWDYKPPEYNVPRTLYWQPCVQFDTKGTATLKFKNKLKIPRYKATIEGVLSNGEIVYYRQ